MQFQKNIVKKHLATLDSEKIEAAWGQYKSYFLNTEIQQNILQSKEEQFQEGFLRELFVKVLGYTLNPSPDYNLITELKNETNTKKADGAILLDGNVIGVIELKDHKTTDLSKIEAQAFGYKNQHVGARLVIISNFEKLRLYIDNAVDYSEWNLFSLTEDDFRELYLCLAWPQVKAGIALQMKTESVSAEDQITKALYNDYSEFKRVLFADIVEHNPQYDKLLLFKKTQKLLDRLLFIFFAEDCGLLPPNSMVQIIDQWEKLNDLDEYQPFYNRVKKYFGYMNTGFKGKKYEIFAYNGGLFKPDDVLDNITITDTLLVEHTKRLSEYDFESEVDVNILGHIFENSLSEIDEITQQINSGTSPQTSKRKQDGVFYTPQYITKYIVENTVGRLCAEKKAELNIVEEEYFSDKNRQKKTKIKLLEQLNKYREWLLQITICDPACGSGAFLNAALQFLINEHRLIDEMDAKVSGASIVFQNIENSILENNLYGVDINEESVEIAQLALWLRTAKPHRKLNTLSQNIKCGNSLISDPAIAGDKAFNWQEQFPKIFRKKQKKAWHITTATHDSRTSQRMIDYKVRLLRDHGMRPYADPMWLDPMEEKIVTETVAEIVKADKLNVLAYNVCGDHMHLVLVCEEDEVPKIVGKIKSMTARAVNIAMGRTVPANPDDTAGTSGHAPKSEHALPTCEDDTVADSGTSGHAPKSQHAPQDDAPLSEKPTRGETQCSLWTRKYGCAKIDTDEYLHNAIEYVKNNRNKHGLPLLENIGIVPTVSVEEAFRPEYDGGFDVVIGNPPYVNMANILNEKERKYYQNNYSTVKNKCDLYSIFTEKAKSLLKTNGLLGFIFPNSWMGTESFSKFREFLSKEVVVYQLVELPPGVFEDAIVTTVLCFYQNTIPQSINIVEIYGCVNKEFVKKDFVLSYEQILKNPNISFAFEKTISLEKVVSKKLSEIASFSLGIKTSDDARFVFDKPIDDTCYKFIRGRNISRWSHPYNNEWLWYQPTLICEKPGGRPRVLENFLVDKKIVIQDIATQITATFDNEKYLCNDTLNIIYSLDSGYSYEYILCLLNSTLINVWFKKIFPAGLHIKTNQLEQIPIPTIDIESQQPFIALADTMLSLNADLQQKRSRFLRRLQENFDGVKITGTLETFDTLQFADFVKELKKQKIKLTLPQQDEWEDYFGQYKSECNRISEEIAETDKKIDSLVYELYGLTKEEIKVVEGK
jgi:type I restriction-modification system DNA methylase subunit/REP element-mobilizing transposase RayT